MSFSSLNVRHSQNSQNASSVFLDNKPPSSIEVVCSSARRRMDHRACHTPYRLFSHTLQLEGTCVPTWPSSTDVCCWYCCHAFDTVPLSIPHARVATSSPASKTYEVYGVFCSLNCAKRFVLETKSYNQQEVLLQLNEVACSVFGLSRDDVFTAREAPSRFFLTMFGGPMSIEEFRSKSLTSRTTLMTPPFVSHAMILESHTVHESSTANHQVVSTTTETVSSSSSSSASPSSLREGRQHMLRGLRRPSRPLTPPPSSSQADDDANCTVSRFEEFMVQMSGSDDNNTAIPKTTTKTLPKRSSGHKKAVASSPPPPPSPPPSNASDVTLTSFLMSRS